MRRPPVFRSSLVLLLLASFAAVASWRAGWLPPVWIQPLGPAFRQAGTGPEAGGRYRIWNLRKERLILRPDQPPCCGRGDLPGDWIVPPGGYADLELDPDFAGGPIQLRTNWRELPALTLGSG